MLFRSQLIPFSVNSVVTKTGAYTLTGADDYVGGNANSSAFTLSLPSAVLNLGKFFIVQKTDSSVNAVTLQSIISGTIDGASSVILANQYELYTVLSDGTNWNVSGHITNSPSLYGPTIQTFVAAGPATYTPTAGTKWIRVRMVGAGGGGSGSGTADGTLAGDGGGTIFGTRTAGGGLGATTRSAPGVGGTTAGSGYTLIAAQAGAVGNSGITQPTVANGTQAAGGSGANSYFGGAGRGAFGSPGGAAVANTGAGGAGGGGDNTSAEVTGSGGGSGSYIEFVITSALAATYSYTVGALGSAGGAGTSGRAGGAGALGFIIVEEYAK